MAKDAQRRTTTSRADPSIGTAEEIEAGGGDPNLELEDNLHSVDPAETRTPRREDDDERDHKPANLKYEEDPREALAKRFAERRANEGRELSTEAEDDEAEEAGEIDADPEVEIVAGVGAREVNRPEPQKPAPRKVTDLTDDDIVVVKVDGAEVEMRYGDMKTRAQKDAAADNRFEKATSLLAEVKDLLRTQNTRPAPAPEQRPAGEAERRDPAPQPDGQSQAARKARLASIVDKLQTETPEQAVEALEGLIAELRPDGNTSQPDVQAVVRQTISDEESERYARVEIGTSFKTVSEDFGDILSDQRLASMAFEDTVKGVVETLRAAGTPDADFAALAEDVNRRNAAEKDPSKHDSFGLAVLREYAKVARDPQYKLKPVKEVMAEGLAGVRKWRTGDVNVPVNDKGRAPAARADGDGGNRGGAQPRPRVILSSTRTERKSGITTQPRSASMRNDFSSHGASPRKDTSKTIASMAESRR